MHNKPKFVIVTGAPGSGKTTLSKQLGKLLYFPVVSRDEIKEGYVNTFNIKHAELPQNTNKIATEVFFRTIELLLTNKVSVIAEAAFQHQVWEPEITRFTKYTEAFVIICEIDREVAARRQIERSGHDAMKGFFHGDKQSEGGYEPPILEVPTIKVCTLNGYDPELDEIRKQITKNFRA